MRTRGTLVTWHDDRGFGFIALPGRAEEIFVHASAFPRDGIRPHVGECISFEIASREDGRKYAVRVMRPGGRTVGMPRRRPTQINAPKPSQRAMGVGLLAVAALGIFGYNHLARQRMEPSAASRALPPMSPAVLEQPFSCDGRTRCSQMRSCSEARYFIKHCPATRMDGDGDGEPCEQQLCGAAHANDF